MNNVKKIFKDIYKKTIRKLDRSVGGGGSIYFIDQEIEIILKLLFFNLEIQLFLTFYIK